MYNIQTDSILSMNENEKREYISECEKRYDGALSRLAADIAQKGKIRLCGLAGPSCAGKTTTSFKLTTELSQRGIWVRTVSIDDFFHNRTNGPADDEGNPDYESPDFVNLDLLHTTLDKILKGETVFLPKYDFVNGSRNDKYEKYTPSPNEIIIIEGLHALNDIMYGTIPQDEYYRIYINAAQDISLDGVPFLSGVELRFFRRVIRDMKFRGSSPENTMQLWENVLKGEIKYIHPFADRADFTINSVFRYEPCVVKRQALAALKTVDESSPHYEYAAFMSDKLRRVPEICEKLVPMTSLLQEFLGGDYFKYD